MPAFKKLEAKEADSQEVKTPAGSQKMTRQRTARQGTGLPEGRGERIRSEAEKGMTPAW